MNKFIKYASIFLVISLAISLKCLPISKPQSFEFSLANGLQVIGIPNHKVPAVTHMLWYKVGAADKVMGKSGFAHLFEHLMFKKTKNLKTGEFSKKIAYYGGNSNAFTGQDYTAYFATITKEHLPLIMQMEADRMKNLIVDKDVLEKELSIVVEERNMRIDNNPSALLSEKLNAALYQTHPYGTPVIGWRDEIAKLDITDVQGFYKKYYNPDNAILVVSGDITEVKLRELATKYYGKLTNYVAELGTTKDKKYSRKNITTAPPKVKNHQVKYADKRVANRQWIKKIQAPSATFGTQSTGSPKNSLPLSLLAYILGGNDTSRLYQSLVIKQNLAVSASVDYNEISLGVTSFNINITPKDGVSFYRIEKALNVEIQKLLDEKITEKELSHIKQAIKAEDIYSKEGVSPMAFLYGQVIASGLDRNYIENWTDNIQKVTVEDISKAAEIIFNNPNFVIGKLISE